MTPLISKLKDKLEFDQSLDIPRHKHTHSVYTYCLECRMWGIDFPIPFIRAAECGNCKSIRTVKYYPSCCVLERAEFEHARLAPILDALGDVMDALEDGEPSYNSAWSMIYLMAEGEGSDAKVYQTMAKAIHAKLKPTLKKLEEALK